MSFVKWKEIQDCLPSSVNLLAVSKGHPASSIRELAKCGQVDFGESRVQEAIPKLDVLKDMKLRWHFIGRLQSNKVRIIVRYFDFIHSIDSFSLAERIDRIAAEEERHPKVMLQVKFRDDPNKGGFLPTHLLEIWKDFKRLKNFELVGLMTMAPINHDPIDRRKLFEECRLLADKLELPHCSMGMSTDWEDALKAGSTWLRIGSYVFGARSKTVKLIEEI